MTCLLCRMAIRATARLPWHLTVLIVGLLGCATVAAPKTPKNEAP